MAMIYRFKALAKRRDPDQLDVPLALATPGGWIVTFVIGFCLISLVGWGFLGRVDQHVTASGVLQFPGGLVTVHSDVEGVVTELKPLGSSLGEGEDIAQLQRRGSVGHTRVSGVTGGRVVQHLVKVGDVVSIGTPIAVVEPGSGEKALLEAVVQVPAKQISAIQVGQDVKLTVSGIVAAKYGLLRGRIKSVAPFPTGTDGVQVGPTMVVVSLEPADTPTGYEWTSLVGPEQQLESQTPVIAEIDVGTVAPLALLGG
ncbi:HlyD family efflux transporter periplasmic adaptor subunit [Arachnia propionica]|uniref:HlyD family efflux transporter periplasmic adaptor subunit n=1 Tax=Arachnia propionica TaxID=1750 RepID=A0A3P1WWW4_9ACTN|nr:HlyD family efflux transporter periplasmic adaptor subunit [Arachnia propionica]RRD50705.1 HlyD family efflux transporter periplasmic adaptor subunit [Arachnia propionica]